MTLERIRAGDPSALEELLQDAWTPLVRHLASLVGPGGEAEELAQEAFVRLWEQRERWEGGSARALVFRIGRNRALDRIRRQDVRSRFVRDAGEGDVGVAPSPAEDLERAELRLRVASALERLAPRRREVLELVRFGGLSHEEVAEAMGISLQTVANHVSLALRDLRAELADLVAPEAEDDHDDIEGRRRDG